MTKPTPSPSLSTASSTLSKPEQSLGEIRSALNRADTLVELGDLAMATVLRDDIRTKSLYLILLELRTASEQLHSIANHVERFLDHGQR